MAVQYYGVNVGGQDATDVTISTSTTSKDIEVAVSDANLAAASISKKLFIETALDAIEQAIAEDTGL